MKLSSLSFSTCEPDIPPCYSPSAPKLVYSPSAPKLAWPPLPPQLDTPEVSQDSLASSTELSRKNAELSSLLQQKIESTAHGSEGEDSEDGDADL